MSRRVRLKKIKGKTTHIRRQSPTLHRAKRVVTLGIVAALILSVGLWAFVRERRLYKDVGAVEVSVGNSLMAHIVPGEIQREEMPLDAALWLYGVRPTSMQQVLLMGEDFSEETTGQSLKEYRLEQKKHELILWKGDSRIGILEWVAVPD